MRIACSKRMSFPRDGMGRLEWGWSEACRGEYALTLCMIVPRMESMKSRSGYCVLPGGGGWSEVDFSVRKTHELYGSFIISHLVTMSISSLP